MSVIVSAKGRLTSSISDSVSGCRAGVGIEIVVVVVFEADGAVAW